MTRASEWEEGQMYAIHALRTFPHTDCNVYALNHELGPWEFAGEGAVFRIVRRERVGVAAEGESAVHCVGCRDAVGLV